MNTKSIWLLAGVITLLLFASSKCVAQTPAGLYTLKYLAWDSNAQGGIVLVKTNPASPAVASFITDTNRAAVSNLQYGVTYYLSVVNAGGESTNYIWPHPREDYFAVENYTMMSLGGNKLWLPGTLRTFTNLPAPSQFVGVAGWVSNNITPHIFSQ